MDHLPRRGPEIGVEARADRRQHAGTQHHGVADLGQGDRHAGDVGVHLHPVAALGGATRGDDLLHLETRRRHGPQVVCGAVAHRLLDGAVDVGGAVVQGQTPDHPAGLRVGVRGAVALEVLVDDEAVGAGRQVLRLLVEDVVDVESGDLRRLDQVAGEVVLEPFQDRTGGDLTALDGVLTLDHTVGVGAEESFAVDRFVGLSRQDVGGTGDQRHHPRVDDTQPDLPGPGVGRSLGDGGAGVQAEELRRDHRQLTDRGAEIDHLLRDLVEDIAASDGFVEVDGPAAVVAVVVHAQRGRVDVGGPLAGQLVGHPVGGVDQPEGRVVGFALVLPQPGGLERVPLGGGRGGAATVVEARHRIRLLRAGGLLGGAHVHPHDGGAEGLAAFVHGNDGHGGGVVGDALDGGGGDAGGGDHLAARGLQRLPPLLRVLFGPAGVGVGGAVRGGGEGNRPAGQVEDGGPHALGAEVDAEEVGVVGHQWSFQFVSVQPSSSHRRWGMSRSTRSST